MSNELHEAELLLAIDLGAIAIIPATAKARTVTVCAALTANKSAVNAEDNPYLPNSAKLDPTLEGLALLPCQDLAIASLPGGYDVGSDRGTHGVYNTSIVALPFDAAALARLPASVAAANIKISIRVGDGFELEPKYRRFAVAPVAELAAGQSTSVVCHKRRPPSLCPHTARHGTNQTPTRRLHMYSAG